MYVLLDMEWVTNNIRHISPTQIAAMRVDDSWYRSALFYSRIRPRDESFHQWSDIAYTGGDRWSFLSAPVLRKVLSSLVHWLRKTDRVCVWDETARDALLSTYQRVFKECFPYDILLLNEYTEAYVRQAAIPENDPYTIAEETGQDIPAPEGYAVNEVCAIQSALRGLRLPAEVLEDSPSQVFLALGQEPDFYLDEQFKVVHAPCCSYLDDTLTPVFYPEEQFFFQKQLTYCGCMRTTIREVNRERNRSRFASLNYRYVYLERSEVFHRADCHLALNTTGVTRGTARYKKSAATGRRPCRVCRPDLYRPSEESTPPPAPKRIDAVSKKKKANKTRIGESIAGMRTLSEEEIRSLKRFRQAQQERLAREDASFASDTEREDFFTLTRSSYGFFAAAGHSSFHLRQCTKLKGLGHIEGFATCREAQRKGFKPCRFCKPTEKNNILFPAQIGSRTQEGETVEVLIDRCLRNGYPYQNSEEEFLFETPVGKWLVNTAASPYIVYHINLVKTPHNQAEYHRQPRLFLSLEDVFRYVQKHDKALMTRASAGCRQTELPQTV